MHAFLIVGNSSTPIESKISEIIKVQKAKQIPFVLQKIEDVRNLKKLVKFSFNEKTAIVAHDIDLATNETLNAFLKNLEEPNNNLIYILTASNIENVISTIVSRCEVTKINSHKPAIDNHEAEQFLKLSTNQKLDFVGKIKERGEAIKFIENLVYFEHSQGNFINMENYLNTIQNLKSNGNVSLQLTAFVVTMNR